MHVAKPVILCLFSGGLDSSGVLHLLLTNDAYQHYEILVHHIDIGNRENRAPAEAVAVGHIVNYYQKKSKIDFLFTQSVFDTTGFAPLQARRFPYDMDICAFMAANVCLAKMNVVHVAMGRTRTDVDHPSQDFLDRMVRAQAIFKSTLMHADIVIPEYIFPVVKYSKKEVWDFLPVEVRENAWWCRRPVYRAGQHPQPCGRCGTCRDMNKIDTGS